MGVCRRVGIEPDASRQNIGVRRVQDATVVVKLIRHIVFYSVGDECLQKNVNSMK